MKQYASWIRNEWVESDEVIDVTNPYDEQLVGRVQAAPTHHVGQAIQAADDAFNDYQQLPAYERADILARTARLLQEREERLAQLLVQETAKPIREAKVEVRRAHNTFLWAAEEAKRIRGETIPMGGVRGGEGRMAFTVRVPLGVVAAITPFNFPLNLVAHKVAPALAAGNTVVLKPASLTPLMSYELALLLAEVGLPAGCFNVISGSGKTVGDYLVRHKSIRMITFTGSSSVGKKIKQKADLRQVTLELGANSAVIVHDGTAIDRIAERCVQGAYAFSGQVCIAVQRIYVQEALYEKFVQKFQERAEVLQCGDPAFEATDVSAMITPEETQRVQQWISEAVEGGANLVTGGTLEGRILRPTVLTNASEHMKVNCEEVFGPVVTIAPYSEFSEAIEWVNNSEYGLQTGVFTNDIQRAWHAIRTIQTGSVIVNDIPTFRLDHMPYGGTKQSGIGKEGVRYAIESMTHTRLAVFNMDDTMPKQDDNEKT